MFTRFATVTLLLLASGSALAQVREGALLEKTDTDHDGKVSRQEFDTARAAIFARLDKNGDGVIDDADSGNRPQASQRAAAVLQRLDSNSDGKVSKEEFVGSQSLLFKQFDADHNDVLDAKELEAARGAIKERFQQRRQQ